MYTYKTINHGIPNKKSTLLSPNVSCFDDKKYYSITGWTWNLKGKEHLNKQSVER